ncbi:MAG: hypothetical protein ACOX61_10005 [Brooklawnia sp.]|jgi:hypothetical protein
MTAIARRRTPAADEPTSAQVFKQYPRHRPDRAGLASARQAGGATRSVERDEAGLQASAQFGRIYTPPGWPESVLPPGAPDWEQSASSWLLDCCPADYRAYPVLRRHPVVLARFAADFVEGQIRSSRQALSQARASLNDYVEPQVLDSAADMLEAEEARLLRIRRGVALVEEALRGKIFIRKL